MILFNSYGQGYFHFSDDLDLESTGTMTFVSSKTKKRLPVANHLTEIEYNILCKANMEHQRSLGLSERDNYSLSYLINVTSFVLDEIIQVHFECGESFYYFLHGDSSYYTDIGACH